MSHRHLVLAYVITWVIQLSYVGFLGVKWRGVRKAEQQNPTYDA